MTLEQLDWKSLSNDCSIGAIIQGPDSKNLIDGVQIKPDSLMTYVQDRSGLDRRYALTSEKIMCETSWAPRMTFEEGLARTIAWYQENPEWVHRVKSGEYRNFYQLNYSGRQA